MATLDDITGTDLATLLLDDAIRIPPMDESRRVFVNRNLRLDKIEAIGFDMDYTLAVYRKFRIEELAFRCTVEKLVASGYPESIRKVPYEPDRVIRGLVVDKRLGNLFKVDRYGHVSRAYHGLRELTKEERIQGYRTQKIDLGTPDYDWVDTLFSLPETCLYAHLVDWLDLNHENGEPDYAKLADDVRGAIDEAHADDSIKRVVKADPSAYVERTPELALTLHRLRSSGKRLFVLTNSYWPYTRTIMSYLLDGVLEGYPSWRNYFELTIVGARKPGFFRKQAPFFAIDEQTDAPCAAPAQSLDKGRIYQGGNLADLERLSGLGGEKVLYVGDHIYGDILLSKKSSLWRTCMIVPELEEIVWHEELFGPDLLRLNSLDDEIKRADYGLNYYKILLNRIEKQDRSGLDAKATAALDEANRRSRQAIDRLRAHLRAQLGEYRVTQAYVDQSYNRYWGRLLVEGNETSLFAQQLDNFACIYTSRVSNFASYSPVQYFRSLPELMPHERRRR